MTYQRYRIEKRLAPNVVAYPHPFKVKIRRWALLKLLVKELFTYRGKKKVLLSRPCAYGVFSGPLGGFAPRQHLCVGCLRCTTQYPEIATILFNPKRKKLDNPFCTLEQMDTLINEAQKGRIAVKGAGYRGKFGGENWDGMWIDMSEIVRPTRDGIYGREYISSEVYLGTRPPYLSFNEKKQPVEPLPKTLPLPFPMLFDKLPPPSLAHPKTAFILSEAARLLRTFSILPFSLIKQHQLKENEVIPLITPSEYAAFKQFDFKPRLLALDGWDETLYHEIRTRYEETFVILRTDFENDLLEYYQKGISLFHLQTNYRGYGKSGLFILDLIRKAHLAFVKAGCRDNVTLIGSGGICAAEHVPKALLAGLDAVALDIPLVIALQGILTGKKAFQLPQNMHVGWGVQRLKNLMGAWQDQLFEFAGAMGLREVRRMRGEIGRALFQKELENEAFSGIAGYDHQR